MQRSTLIFASVCLSIFLLFMPLSIGFASNHMAPKLPVRAASSTGMNSHPQVGPVIQVLVEGSIFAPGQPITITMRLTNTTKRTIVIGDSAGAVDWNPIVYWLGGDGKAQPVPVQKTAAGEQELRPLTNVLMTTVTIPPGSGREFGPFDINRLYEMGRHGVYMIRAGHEVSWAGSWHNSKPGAPTVKYVLSAPVSVLVR